jgi:hypothetical protein
MLATLHVSGYLQRLALLVKLIQQAIQLARIVVGAELRFAVGPKTVHTAVELTLAQPGSAGQPAMLVAFVEAFGFQALHRREAIV